MAPHLGQKSEALYFDTRVIYTQSKSDLDYKGKHYTPSQVESLSKIEECNYIGYTQSWNV